MGERETEGIEWLDFEKHLQRLLDGEGAYVEVDEHKVYATKGGDWWWFFRRTHEPCGRITIVRPEFLGDVVRVACVDKEDAEGLVTTLTEIGGLPKSALKVGSSRGAAATTKRT